MNKKLSKELRLAYLCMRQHTRALTGKGSYTRYLKLLKELNREKMLNHLTGFLINDKIIRLNKEDK